MTVAMEREATTTTGVESQLTMPASVFRDGLAGALVAASKDDTLPVLCVVLVEWDGADVRFVATDRYRLAVGVVSTSDSVRSAGTGRVLIDRKTAAELVKALPKAPLGLMSGLLALTVLSESRASVRFHPEWVREFATIVGDFPKYRALIPGECTEPVSGVAWNPDYMADAAKIPHGKNMPVRWMFSAPYKPAVASYEVHNEIEWRYVLMPVRIR